MAKPTIVTRATKGSALTWTEGDANITNLKDATIAIKAGSAGTSVVSDLNGEITLVAGTNVTLTGDNTAKTVTINAAGGSGITDVVQDTTPQLGGSLDVNGNAIVSASNGNIRLEPNGSGNIALTPTTGKITLGALDFPTSMGSNGQVLTTNGSSAMTWTTVSGGATTLDGLTDVVITAAATNDVLVYNGTNWVDTAASTITVGTATNATAVANTGAYNTAGTNYISFVGTNTTSNQASRTSAGLTIDPSTGVTSVWGIVSTGAFQRNSGRTSGTLGNGSGFSIGAATWADTTTAAGTVATEYISYFNTPTITHANAVTVTEAATLALADPVASTNTTFTNKYSLVAAGRIKASDFTGTIGATTQSAASFTTLAASSTVSGTGFSTYLASPPAIGGTTSAAITATALTAKGATNSAKLTLDTTSVSSTAWTTNGVGLKIQAATFTDTSSTAGTVAASYVNSISAPTLASTNAITVTDAATLSLASPIAGTNTTITNNYALLTAGNIKAGTIFGNFGTISNAQLGYFSAQIRTGNLSQTAWTTSGIAFRSVANTFTDTTTAAGTSALKYVNIFDTPTVTHTNAVTVTELANLYIAAPAAGTNTTVTNPYAILAGGNVKINAQGELRLADTDSTHWVGFKAPATVTTNRIWTLPAADGTANQVLKTDGAGVLGWATAGGGNNIIEISTGEYRMVMPSTAANTTSTFVAESTGGVSGISVSASTFTLPAGTYIMEFPFSTSSSTSFYSDLQLWNNGGSTSLLTIGGQNMDQNNALYYRWSGKYKFTLASSTTLSFRNETAPGTGYNIGIGPKTQFNALFSVTFKKIA